MAEITETEIRARLCSEVEALKGSRNRLADLITRIPPSPQETSEEDLRGPFDLATEVRGALAFAIRESLNPLLKNLRAAADYRPAEAAHECLASVPPPAPALLDLAASEEAMRPVVYALVVMDYFTARRSDEEPGEVWLPAYSPEQAGLLVWKRHGRWYAAWQKLEVPATAREDERWEVLLIEEDPRLRGNLIYREIQPG